MGMQKAKRMIIPMIIRSNIYNEIMPGYTSDAERAGDYVCVFVCVFVYYLKMNKFMHVFWAPGAPGAPDMFASPAAESSEGAEVSITSKSRCRVNISSNKL
jgi:hypothetical protein